MKKRLINLRLLCNPPTNLLVAQWLELCVGGELQVGRGAVGAVVAPGKQPGAVRFAALAVKRAHL
jgi:hypothetical protein